VNKHVYFNKCHASGDGLSHQKGYTQHNTLSSSDYHITCVSVNQVTSSASEMHCFWSKSCWLPQTGAASAYRLVLHCSAVLTKWHTSEIWKLVIWLPVFRCIAKLWKATASATRMEQLGSHQTDFHGILYFEYFSKICGENSNFIKIWRTMGTLSVYSYDNISLSSS